MGLNNKSGITPWLRANGSKSQSLAKNQMPLMSELKLSHQNLTSTLMGFHFSQANQVDQQVLYSRTTPEKPTQKILSIVTADLIQLNRCLHL